jgi:hypothetical protein
MSGYYNLGLHNEGFLQFGTAKWMGFTI